MSAGVQDLGEPEFGHYFVKKLVAAALDKNDRAREQASTLLSSLYAVVRLWARSSYTRNLHCNQTKI